MRVTDNGFFPWLFWAFFSWKGVISRRGYIGAMLCFLVVLTIYTFLVGQVYARYLIPPPGGLAPDMEYMLGLLRSGQVSSYAMLPLLHISILLDAKRLRSMGALPWISVIINVLNAARPDMPETLASLLGVLGIAYLLIMALVPPLDTARPVNQRPASRSSGNGPRRMSGKELTNWRLIAPAPRKSTDHAPDANPQPRQETGED